MRQANAWHNHERVYIQARSGGTALVQYVEREVVPLDKAFGRGKTVAQWAWVPDDDVLPFTEFDTAMLAVWKIA